MIAVFSLASHTFWDALRERAFSVVLIFAILVLVLSRLVAPLALGEARRITIDLGLAAIGAFTVLLVVLLGTRMVQKEIDSRTILVLLSKPVSRSEFLLGKFLGLAAVATASVLAMALVLIAVLAVSGYDVGWTFAVACLDLVLSGVLLCALSMLLTAFSSPVLATFFLIGAYVAGRLAPEIRDAASLLPPGIAGTVVGWLLLVVPRLDLLQRAMSVVHGISPEPGQVVWAVAYSVLYGTAALLLAAAAFSRREFS